MTNNKDLLIDYKAMDETENVALGDGRVVKAHGYGNVYMKMKFDVGNNGMQYTCYYWRP